MCTTTVLVLITVFSFLFQFPSNGKAHVHWSVKQWIRSVPTLFQFPSNGKAHVHLPYFRPTPRLTPEPLIQTRTARGLFFTQKLERKSPKPLQTLIQTRFLPKNTREFSHRIGLWAISSSDSAQGRIAFVLH